MKWVEIPNRYKTIEFKKYGTTIKLEFFGWVWNAEKWVSLTGSATRLEIIFPDWRKVSWLVDFGMFQWCKNALKYNEILPFDLSKIDFVIITHTHIDHIWKLLHFWKDEFTGKIWTTDIASNLIWVMLKDVIKLQPKPEKTKKEKLEAKLKNLLSLINNWLGEDWKQQLEDEITKILEEIRNLGNNEEEEKNKKFFTQEDLDKLFRKINKIGYYQKVEVANDITLSFIKAGHLPGSAQAILKIKTKKWPIVLWFSWDLWKFRNPSIWNQPDISKENLDLYLVESTYAWRKHREFIDEEKSFIAKIKETIRKKWKIIIPVFVQWRAQEVIYYLYNLMEEWKIPNIPVYMHSETIGQINNIINLIKDETPGIKKLKKILKSNFIKKAVSWKGKNKQLIFEKYTKSAILIASWWMVDWWTIMNYLKYLQEPNYLFVSMWYQGEWTLWRKIFTEQISEIAIPWEWKIKINAKLHNFRWFSGHADENDLLEIISKMNFKKGAKIIINHWENTLEQQVFGLKIKWILGKTKEVLFAEFSDESYCKK